MDRQLTQYHYAINPLDPKGAHYWQLKFLASAHSVLEIGCSSGIFSQYLTARGQRVTGVEIHPGAAELARTVCTQVILGDIETSQVRSQIDGRFEAVLLGDVLEHLQSPDQLLKIIRTQWLLPGGWVVVSVPNSGHWVFRREVLHGRFPYRQTGLFDRTHVNFYTYRSLLELVTGCGYQVNALAHSVNPNSQEDITFTILEFLYRHPVGHLYLRRFEACLARLFPNLFAYQFILLLKPLE